MEDLRSLSAGASTLDEWILGEHYREDSIVIEAGADHFDLIRTERVLRHVDEMVRALRES